MKDRGKKENVTFSISACRTFKSFLDCWSSCVSLVLVWSSCCSKAWWVPCSWESSYITYYKEIFFSRYRSLMKHDKTFWGHRDGRLLHLLTDSFLVLELLLQGSFAAFSVVPLTAHLLSHLFELLLNCWTLTTRWGDLNSHMFEKIPQLFPQ